MVQISDQNSANSQPLRQKACICFSTFLFIKHESSSSSLHIPAEIIESPFRPEFGPAKFSRFCSHKAKNILQLALKLWNWKERPEKLRPLSSLSTSYGLLGWWSQALGSGQNVSLNQNSQPFFLVLPELACSIMSIWSWKTVLSLGLSLKFDICCIAKFGAYIL